MEPKTKTKEVFREYTKPPNQPYSGKVFCLSREASNRVTMGWKKRNEKYFKKFQKIFKNLRKIVQIKFCENYFFLLTMSHLFFFQSSWTRGIKQISLWFIKNITAWNIFPTYTRRNQRLSSSYLRWLLGLRKLRSSEKVEILQIGLVLRVA